MSPAGSPTFRKAAPADALVLARMRWDFRAEGGETPIESFDAFERRFLAHFITGVADGTWTRWIAEVDGVIVATMSVHKISPVPRPSRLDDQWGYVTDCYTVPRHRNRGIGAALLGHVVAWAREQDFEELIVSPAERARPFYERAGFGPDDDFLLLRLRGDDGGLADRDRTAVDSAVAEAVDERQADPA